MARFFDSPGDEDRLVAKVESVRKLRASTPPPTQDLAMRVGAIRRAYPVLTSSAVAFAEAGLDPSSPEVQQAAAAAARAQGKKNGGFKIGSVVRGITRTAAMIAESPLQEVQGVIRGAGYGGVKTRTQGGNYLANVAEGIANAGRSSLVKAEQQFIKDPIGNLTPAATKPGAEVDLGTGFFVGGQVEAQRKASSEVLQINDQPITTGRVVARRVSEPGSKPYNAVSGMIDLGVALGADPTNAALSKVGQIRKARRLFVEPETDRTILGRVAESAGLVNGTRKTVLTDRVGEWLAGDGQKVIENLADDPSFVSVWKKLGRKVDVDTAIQLADARSRDEVKAILHPLLGVTIREKPTLPSAFKAEFSRYTEDIRLLQKLPGRHFDIDDANQSVTQMERFLSNAKVDRGTRAFYMEKMARAKGRPEKFQVIVDAMDDVGAELLSKARGNVVGDAYQGDLGASVGRKVFLGKIEGRVQSVDPSGKLVVDFGGTRGARAISPDALAIRSPQSLGGAASLRKMTKLFQNSYEETSKFFTKELGENAPIQGALINGTDRALPSPHLYNEYINQLIPSPDARAIRRMTSRYGRVLNKPGLDLGVATLDFLSQDVWKPLVLIRGAWTVRVVGEEQVRMGATGLDSLFNHPLSAIAWLTGREARELPEDAGRVARAGAVVKKAAAAPTRALGKAGRGETDILGGRFDPTDEASDLFGALTKNGGGWRDKVVANGKTIFDRAADPDGYLGGWMGELGQLANDPIGVRVAGGLRDGDVAPRVRRTVTDAPAEAAHADLPPLFHGSSRPIAGQPQRGGGQVSENLFGPGFYTTADEGVAKTYQAKGAGGASTLNPRTYGIKWKGTAAPRILDMEQRPPDELVSRYRQYINDQIEVDWIDGDVDKLGDVHRALDTGTGVELYTAIKRYLASAELPRYEVDDILAELNEEVLGGAFDALKHQGGVRRGAGKLHDVYIFLDPENVAIAERVPQIAEEGITGLDAVKEWFYAGAGSKFRNEMAQSRGGDVLLDRVRVGGGSYADDGLVQSADDYIASVFDRVQIKTGGDQRLVDAVASGKIGERTFKDKAIVDDLRLFLEEGVGPQTVKGDITLAQKTTAGGKVAAGLDHAVDTMFGALMSKPTNALSRSSTFRQMYYKRVEELLPFMDEAAQQAAITGAKNAGLTERSLSRMARMAGKGAGDLVLEDADVVAKGFALDGTKKLLYDLTEKNQLSDIARLIAPFGEAWKEILTVWTRIGTENPRVLRRGQQGIKALRDNGWFKRDEQTGEEVFVYPGSQFLTGNLLGVPTPLTGRVAGLNLFSSGPILIPGFGPAVQVPASHLIPNKPGWDSVREIVIPFGEQDTSGGFAESFLPAWFQKFRKAIADPESDKAFSNTVMDVARYLQSSGDYDLSTVEGQERLSHDAVTKSRGMYLIRMMAQFVAPSAPTPEFLARDKNGNLTTAFKLAQAFRDLQAVDYTTAVEQFIDLYGEDALLYMQPKSSGGFNPTDSLHEWVRENPELATRYPDVYGFFAPSGGEFDITELDRQLATGERENLKPNEALALANARVASMKYRQAKERVGASPSASGRAWLSAVKDALVDDYPGYQPEKFEIGKAETSVRQLQAALEDPKIAKTDAGQGLAQYLRARDRAMDIAERNGLDRGSFAKAKAMRPVREWLRQIGDAISEEHPDFAPLFERVLDNEMVADVDVTEGAA